MTVKRDLSHKRVVAGISPGPRRVIVWDARLPGFGLDVWPSGRKSWVLQYRAAGRSRRMTLGTADRVPPAQARAEAMAALATLHHGADPLELRRRTAAPKGQATIREVAAGYLATLEKSRSARWAREARRIYEQHVDGALGRVRAADIGVREIRKLHESMVATPVLANRTKAVLSAILSRAATDGDRPGDERNPASQVKDWPEEERDRYLADDEWPRVARAIATLTLRYADLAAHDTRMAQLNGLVLLALTGARLRSVLPRRWSDIDWEERAIIVEPAHKGVSRILLGEPAAAFLRGVQATQRGPSDFLFPGSRRRVGTRTARHEKDTRALRSPTAIQGIVSTWSEVQTLANLEGFTLHDWRRTFATVAGDVGISDHMIGGLLGHTVPGIRRRYARRTDKALLSAADRVSEAVARRLFPALGPAL